MKGKEALSGLQITSTAFNFIPHLLRAVKVCAGEVCLAALGLRVLLHWGLIWRRSRVGRPLALAPDGLCATPHA